MSNFFAGLDYYKLTMSQQAWRVAPDAEVTFTLRNRGAERLLDVIEFGELRDALRKYTLPGTFFDADFHWLDVQGFDVEYLRWLRWARFELPTPEVSLKDGDIHVEVTGKWPLVTFWETVVMSTINELYFRGEIDGKHYTEGHDNLSHAIETIRDRPSIKISDFGTRRRLSRKWHETVVERLSMELPPEQFLGTSNPHFAREFGLKPIGTFAHEMPMVYAALAEGERVDPLGSHNVMLNDWYYAYRNMGLDIALTDTFGTDFFFATFGPDRAREWKGLRHDSGDPFEFGEKAVKFYESFGIDPTTKTIVFSDGLNLNKIVTLEERFAGRIGTSYGWGTGLTNNVGLKPLNIVMKATSVDGRSTVKLSDDKGKHTGTPEAVNRYLSLKRHWL